MSRSLFSSLALSLALAAPTAAFAYVTEITHYHRVVVVHHEPTPPNLALSRRQLLTIEGLTRDQDDCQKYGCLGSNGQ